ncbi:hypothetical protein FJ872_17910 [Mesorhizobium sp. B2-5-9]|uniref:hypothetical protein n=1 Tax=Mesorhizobium sp. B2-5-9 TaxID=2589921 RepID=UPI001127B3ED|nr:hypothetical protein [Mesorhizobium sp. B2-5-9]TPK16677.1 hypothetical protein FJ872_17910 [Mesorhizobium sp. B2-5-9]
MAEPIERMFHGEFSKDEVLAWIDEVFDANPKLMPKGINVSNRIHEMGIGDNYRDVKIAADPQLWPDDTVRIVFDIE